MFGVDDRGDPTGLLSLGCGMQCQRCFTTRFGAKNLDHAATRNTLSPQSHIEAQTAGRNAINLQLLLGPQRHDRAVAKGLFDLLERGFEAWFAIQNSLHSRVDLARFRP